MRLSLLSKIQTILRKNSSLPNVFTTRSSGSKTNSSNESKEETHCAVILREKRNSIQIACWNCGHRLWVKRGSRCCVIGLCSKCIGSYDPTTRTIKKD